MTAWVFVLVVSFGYNNGMAIPNIASLAECQRLGDELVRARDGLNFVPYQCHGYRTTVGK